MRLDIQCCALLLILTAVMLLPGVITLPMEVWDESRTANNAMEIAKHGGWLVPTFGYAPDRWNTKPPLLIWIIAALLRTGLDPMLAVRLPSVAATLGSVLLVYLACRVAIQDRMAGVLGGLLVICSTRFMGDHAGRTGDYDALLSFFCLGFVLCAGRYIDTVTDRFAGWICAAGILLFLALMTKGVAAAMVLPGLLAYAILRRRFLAIAHDRRLWTAAICVVSGMAGWLALREHLDPGYFAAMWYNDVGGRLLITLDQHAEGPLYYLMELALNFQPAILLSPTLLAVRRDPDPVRRRLCLLTILTAMSWLVIISGAGTKLYWYVAPVVPLLAIAIAIATISFLRLRERPLSGGVVIGPVIVAMLFTFWQLNLRPPTAPDQLWYGSFLDKIRGDARSDGAIVVDRGLPNDSEFHHYNPVARFFTEDATWRGEHIRIVSPDAPIAHDATIVSCDPGVRDWLKAQSFFTIILVDAHCVLGHVSMREDEFRVPE